MELHKGRKCHLLELFRLDNYYSKLHQLSGTAPMTSHRTLGMSFYLHTLCKSQDKKCSENRCLHNCLLGIWLSGSSLFQPTCRESSHHTMCSYSRLQFCPPRHMFCTYRRTLCIFWGLECRCWCSLGPPGTSLRMSICSDRGTAKTGVVELYNLLLEASSSSSICGPLLGKSCMDSRSRWLGRARL